MQRLRDRDRRPDPLRAVFSLTYILGVVDVLMIFSANRRTLHDRVAKTLVVYWKR